MPTSVFSFLTRKISVETARVKIPDCGPNLPLSIALWNLFTKVEMFPSWLISVENTQPEPSKAISRGYCCDFTGIYGKGEVQVLLWNPPQQVNFLLSTPHKRIAVSLKIVMDSNIPTIILNGEWELDGWVAVISPWYRARLKRDFNEMCRKIENLLSSAFYS